MNRRSALAVLAVAVVLAASIAVVAAPALGHVPTFPTDNDDPGNATVVADPAKSQVFYDSIAANESAYYRTELDAGDRLQVSTFTPRETTFRPGFVVIGPGLNGTADVPPQVEVPAGYGAVVVEPAEYRSSEYEPFTPAALSRTAGWMTTVESGGTYYVAVYEPDRQAGPVGVVVGQEESFTLGEFVTVPLDRPRIHEWEGQPAWLVYGPMIVGVLGTLGAFAWWTTDDQNAADDQGGLRTSRAVGLAVASALYSATAASVAVQTAIAVSVAGVTSGVLVTLAFLVVPSALAWYLLGRATDRYDVLVDAGERTRRHRATLLAVAALGVATWAGFVVGPAIVVLAAVLPAD